MRRTRHADRDLAGSTNEPVTVTAHSHTTMRQPSLSVVCICRDSGLKRTGEIMNLNWICKKVILQVQCPLRTGTLGLFRNKRFTRIHFIGVIGH